MIIGADGEWETDSTEGLLFSSEADFSKFVGVKVDGVTVEATNQLYSSNGFHKSYASSGLSADIEHRKAYY